MVNQVYLQNKLFIKQTVDTRKKIFIRVTYCKAENENELLIDYSIT